MKQHPPRRRRRCYSAPDRRRPGGVATMRHFVAFGFTMIGSREHPEDGEVWEWERIPAVYGDDLALGTWRPNSWKALAVSITARTSIRWAWCFTRC